MLDTAHLPERFGLFTIIVLGESILAVVKGVSDVVWHNEAVIAAGLAFLIAVCLWWIYFTFLEKTDEDRPLGSGQPYIYAHLPLFISTIMIGVGVELTVIQTSTGELKWRTLYLLCGGIALWLFSFLVIQLVSTMIEKKAPIIIKYLSASCIVLILMIIGADWPPLIMLTALNLICILLLARHLYLKTKP